MKVLFLILFCFYSLAQSQQDNDSIKVEIEEITLQEVVDTALSNNYDLRAFKYEVSTLEKIKIQAGLIPNPEIEFEAENILGSKELRRIDNGEFTLLGSQLFELGGKRSSRVNLVENQVLSAQSQYELLKIDVIANVKSAFFDLYKTQSQIELQKKFIQINEEILKTISERVKAGRTSPAEESKVKIALVNSRIEFDRLQRLFNTFQNNLNALLGISGQNLMPKSELFENIPEPTDLNKLRNEIEKFPSLQLLYKEKQVREAQLTLEQSQAIPDLTINGGI
ncbi:MAG: TolC family protein, partial [Ignavibacteria bacterium]|nr:TolC family protein [Ignavibacteria bacterium]